MINLYTMSLIKNISELMNIKITNDLTIDEEEKLLVEKRKLHNIIVNYFKCSNWECLNDDCLYNTNNIDKFIRHEHQCYKCEEKNENIFRFISRQNYHKYLPETIDCIYCLKTFNSRNLLSQHQNRGKRLGCLDKVIKDEIESCSTDEKVSILRTIRKMKKDN
jgi:hypothetical protein